MMILFITLPESRDFKPFMNITPAPVNDHLNEFKIQQFDSLFDSTGVPCVRRISHYL